MSKIIIQAPRQGIASSPFVGFGNVQNLDIDSTSGVAKLNNILVKKSGSTVTAQVNWIVQDPVNTANFYALDSSANVYNSTDSGATWASLSTRSNAGQGLAIWKDYLFVAETTTIDVYGPLSGAPAWTNNFKTIDSDTLWHPMLISKNDGKLYGGAGRFVFSLEEVGTFNPANAATYTWTQQALDLPSPYKIKCIEELGNNLMLGTWQGTNVYDIRVGDIFPWDRSSVSFGQPVIFAEYGVHAMLNVGNSLVVLAGINGTIFRCDGANAYIIGQLPINLSGGKYLEFYPGAICNYKNKVFFGVGNGGTTANAGQGIYSLLQTGRGNILNLEHQNSQLTDGSAASVKISALLPVSRDQILAAFRSNTTYGIDLTTNTSYAYSTDYSGSFDSQIIDVGVNENKWKPAQAQLRLGRPLRTGEGIQLSYRASLADSFTVVKTLAYADNGVGAIITKTFPIQIPDNVKQTDQVQFRIGLLGNTTSPEFKTLIIE